MPGDPSIQSLPTTRNPTQPTYPGAYLEAAGRPMTLLPAGGCTNPSSLLTPASNPASTST